MIAVDRLIAAPAEVVWDVLVDLDAWPIWGPTVRGGSLDAPHTELALNVTGTVHTALGLSAPFTITEFEPGRHWAWRVAGIPATHHRVEPLGEHCRASMSAPLWASAYLTVCAIALRRIEAIATARR